MFGFNLNQAKSMFLDRKAVTSRLSRAKRKGFGKAGGLTRKIARNSMRPASKRLLRQIAEKRVELKAAFGKRKTKIQNEIRVLQKQASSQPGKPPKTIKGTIKKQLYYGYDTHSESVVVGPILFAPNTRAQETLEFGGQVSIGPQRVQISERPYMGPAREKVQPQLAGFFKDSF